MQVLSLISSAEPSVQAITAQASVIGMKMLPDGILAPRPQAILSCMILPSCALSKMEQTLTTSAVPRLNS